MSANHHATACDEPAAEPSEMGLSEASFSSAELSAVELSMLEMPEAKIIPGRHHKLNRSPIAPKVSIILLDWSCRESFHALHWLQKQDVPRSDYEIIWIELRNRVLPEAMQNADVVVTLDQKGTYHKHLGYNVGLLLARGEVITICDSDAVFPADFVSSILKSFWPSAQAETPVSQVLMHHEPRTWHRYPQHLNDAAELKDPEKWQWWPLGYNVGACVTLRTLDAIRFGGFDEHKSLHEYLCGPYDLAWRLVNAGLPEIWHDHSTMIWHFAHEDPGGTSGILPSFRKLWEIRYPHVDMHALTCVEHFSTGRLLPLKENRLIHERRMAARQVGSDFEWKYATLTGPEGYSSGEIALWRILLFFRLLSSPLRHRMSNREVWKRRLAPILSIGKPFASLIRSLR